MFGRWSRGEFVPGMFALGVLCGLIHWGLAAVVIGFVAMVLAWVDGYLQGRER